MILTFMRCHLSSGIIDSKINVQVSQVFYTYVHKFRGRLLYKLNALRLTPFQAYHVCSSLIARKNGVPGVKHHTSNIHHILQVV